MKLYSLLPFAFVTSCTRVTEAFDRSHDQVTGIDNLVMGISIVGIVLVVVLIVAAFAAVLEDIYETIRTRSNNRTSGCDHC